MLKEFLSYLTEVAPLNETIQTDFLHKLKLIRVPQGKILLSEGEICDKFIQILPVTTSM